MLEAVVRFVVLLTEYLVDSTEHILL